MIFSVIFSSWPTFIALCLTVGVILLFQFFKPRTARRLPPGPFALPILGNLTLFRNDPRTVLQNLKKNHGEIYSLYFGKELAVVIHGYSNIKEAFVKRGDVFSGRPSSRLSEQVCPDKGLISSSGDKWKRERMFAVSALGDLGFRKTLVEGRVLEEIDCFLDLINQNCNRPYDISLPIHTSVSNVISSFVLGKKFKHNDQEFKDYIERLLENYRSAGATAALNYLPFLDYLPGDLFHFKKTLKNIHFIVDFVREIVESQLNSYDEDNIEDFVSAYAKRVKNTGAEVDVEQLTHVVTHLFVAGTESVATAIRWIFFYLCKFPEVQEKIHCEIDANIPADGHASWEDRDLFPYTYASTLEVLRHADLAPLGVAHSATVDTEFKGYFIPKGTMLIPYVHGVLHDEETWKNPDKFIPERFINEDGKVNVPEQFIPYSLGRRTCIGEHLAKMEIFLFITSVLRRFRVKLADGPQPGLTDSQFGLTVTPMPFKLVFTPKQGTENTS